MIITDEAWGTICGVRDQTLGQPCVRQVPYRCTYFCPFIAFLIAVFWLIWDTFLFTYVIYISLVLCLDFSFSPLDNYLFCFVIILSLTETIFCHVLKLIT